MEITWGHLFLDAVDDDAPEAWSFWQAATGTTRSAPRGHHDQFATLLPEDGDPWLKLQKVGAAGGVHLDLHVADRAAAVDEAVALGAVVRTTYDDVTVMASPGGFAFCLVDGETDRGRQQVRPVQGTLLDQLCIDVPVAAWESEQAFWTALTGWELRPGSMDSFVSLLRPEGFPVRLLLQRLEDPDGVVRGHPDFACSDLTAAAMEHQALGSRPVGGGRFWTVMEHRAAGIYCLTVRDPATGLVPPAS